MLKELVNRSITVDAPFLEWRDMQDWATKCEGGVNYLLLEYTLIKEKAVEEGYDLAHDFIYKDMRVDIKEVQKYFNVYSNCPGKVKWWEDKIDEGALTHFLFVQSDRVPNKDLVLGETVSYSYVGLWDALDILAMLTPSYLDNGGYYIATKDLGN